MKKSNVVLGIIILACSIFLLWLWFALGFNHVDKPLDLILSIIWWVLLIIAIIVIVKMEKKRQQKVRTMYVGAGQLFNSEAGTVQLQGVGTYEGMQNLLEGLEYGFGRADLPENANQLFSKIVRSETFKKSDNDLQWEGEVVDVATKAVTAFSTPEELKALL